MPLIAELLIAWTALSVLVGLPLGRLIRRADAREYPLREAPWWCEPVDGLPEREPSALRPRAGALV